MQGLVIAFQFKKWTILYNTLDKQIDKKRTSITIILLGFLFFYLNGAKTKSVYQGVYLIYDRAHKPIYYTPIYSFTNVPM